MEYALGVDLGTTHIAAAVHIDGRVEMVGLGDRHPEMPAVIHLGDDGRMLVGDSAERAGRSDPARLAREIKRRMGDPVPMLVGGAPFSAHALLGRLLKHVADTVTALYDGPPARIVVTHPANWGPYKREQLEQVFAVAGLTGVRTLTEPEAAAVHHASTQRVSPGDLIAVYDLGGGTFDAAVLRRTASGYEMPGPPAGIEQLGGMDFDEAVWGHVARVLGDEITRPADADFAAALSRLRRDCVEGKEALSFDVETHVPVALPGFHTRVRITRAEFEAMITPALADTVEAVDRAVRGAGVTAEEITVILLSGGSSRIPLVRRVITEAYARPVALDPHPEHSIARGAALVAALPVPTPAPAFAPPASPAAPVEPAALREERAERPPLPRATVRATAPTADSTQPILLGAPAPAADPLGRQRRLALIAAAAIVLIGAVIGATLALT